MVFSSLVFLCIFLPITLILYLLCPCRYRNVVLMAASLLFYAWGEPKYILIMLFSTTFDYANGRLLAYFDEKGNEAARKRVLLCSVAGNLLILFFFKYTDFVITSWNQLTYSHLPLLKLALPIGISFYTFQTMSYTIDVYRRRVKVQKDFIAFSMYVCMFPQLIAGPIVRYETIEAQLYNRKRDEEAFARGMQRFLMGLGKKVIFANQAGNLWNAIDAMKLSEISTVTAWIGAIAYTLQIYFDFSGYSDMAIGLGQIFGFSFPENFKYPYETTTITDFWRRWHITLGTWFREYVYIPLGGNRKGLKRQFINLLVVWSLTGLWHGASWNFVVWGLYFFVILFFEKVYLLKKMICWPKILQHLYAKVLIIIGWVLFSIENFQRMGGYLLTMFGLKGHFADATGGYYFRTNILFLLVLAIASTRIPHFLLQKVCDYFKRNEKVFYETKGKQTGFVFSSIYTLLILFLSLAMLISGSYNPFLYFRF